MNRYVTKLIEGVCLFIAFSLWFGSTFVFFAPAPLIEKIIIFMVIILGGYSFVYLACKVSEKKEPEEESELDKTY